MLAEPQMLSWLACPFVLCVPAPWQSTMILFTSITAAVLSASHHHRQRPPRSLAFDGVTPLSARLQPVRRRVQLVAHRVGYADQAYWGWGLQRANGWRLTCAKYDVTLIAPLRPDACLCAPAPVRQPGQNGRPRIKGKRLPKLSQVLADPKTTWQQAKVKWCDGSTQPLEWCSGPALWYRAGQPPLPIRSRHQSRPSRQTASAHLFLDRSTADRSLHPLGCASSAGRLKSPSRRVAPIWVSKRSGNGRIWPLNAALPVCLGSTVSWLCWVMPCIRREIFLFSQPLGIANNRRPLAMS